MNVLLLGSGAREHAIAWRLAQSPLLGRLWVGPGNAGTAQFGENIEARIAEPEVVVALATRLRADLVIVGPEDPLAAGVADALEAAGVAVFGPTRAAAEIEWSKSYAKALMQSAGIQTAEGRTFHDAWEARDFARVVFASGLECVVKADGLAAGKGVTVCDSVEDAIAAIEASMVNNAFGPAGASVVIEERMRGRETSAMAFTDGVSVAHMPFSCDHKPVFDGDSGPNTGGMGAYSPPGWLDASTRTYIQREVTERTVRALTDAGRPYRGVIYPGMMLTEDGPRVVEYNSRFGDPETEVILPRLRTDLLAICDAVAHGRLAGAPVAWDEAATVGVVMASGGYPGAYETGLAIDGLEAVDSDVQVFFAGAQRDDRGVLRTAGGRVLCVVARGATVSEARTRAYDNVRRIHFEGAHYRTDIGAAADLPIEVRGVTRLVRCAMRECRRSIDLDTLPPLPARPEPAPCLHYIAAWGVGRSGMVEEVLAGLNGNREFVIRNLRPPEVAPATIEAQRTALEAVARQFAREVLVNPEDLSWGGALFGDPHERDAVSREMAQLVLGPDPMVSRVMG